MRDIFIYIAIGLGFIAFTTGLFVLQASANSTDETDTTRNGQECITRIHYDNRLFGEDNVTINTFCKD